MKTAIQSLFALTFTAVVLTSSAFNTFAKDEVNAVAVSGSPVTYSMIQVKGNVRLHLRQGRKESIRVETAVANDVVAVEQIGQKLKISSDASGQADVYITVKDLRRIDASGTAEVITGGAFNLNVLQVFLNDNAHADVKVNTNGIYTIVKGHSRLKLSGRSDQHISVKENGSNLNTSEFACSKTETKEAVLAMTDLDVQFEESLNPSRVSFIASK